MRAYQTKAGKINRTDFHELRNVVMHIFKRIKKKSKRSPYVRSAYFNKEKIFLNLFWSHLFAKENWNDRVRRLRYFEAAIELIEKNRFEPTSKNNPNKSNEVLYRFMGVTPEKEIFYVQIKENPSSERKDLISIFPGK